MKAPFIIYADLKSLLKKISTCHNNPEKSSTTKITEHTPSVDNLSEGLHKDKCIDCKSCLDYMMFKDDQLIFRCFECKKYYKKDFNKDLIKRFSSIYEFCNRDINKFNLLLRKGVYPYQYMDSWERFDEKLLPSKKDFKVVSIC